MFRLPKRHRRSLSLRHGVIEEIIEYVAPSSLVSNLTLEGALNDVSVGTSSSTASVVSGGSDNDEYCAICLGCLSDNEPSSFIRACNHVFHDCCIRDWLLHQQNNSCPVCQVCVGVQPQSLSPTGTMTIQYTEMGCPGFSVGTKRIEIIYHIPSGIQHSFHQHPNVRYGESTRAAYLPNTNEGMCLLIRLRLAFERGYTFTVGTSLSSGCEDSVIWTGSFDHKTSICGGQYGFPDAHYITRCNAQLDAIGISAVDNTSFYPALQNNEVVRYTAPQNVGPRTLLPNVLASVISEPPRRRQSNQSNQLQSSGIFSLSAHRRRNSSISTTTTGPPIVPDDKCIICFDNLSDRTAMQVKMCNHVFHHDCIEKCFHREPRCPVCRVNICEPQGNSPSGTMSVKCLKAEQCPGFKGAKTIKITYRLPSGIQKQYHDNPNSPFKGTARESYLPNTEPGRRLLTRLKYAWTHGLTFTIGTSLTTGRPNVVTWTSIPHKTSLNSTGLDPHAFPDPQYITNCNKALDTLGVPDADTCLKQPAVVLIN